MTPSSGRRGRLHESGGKQVGFGLDGIRHEQIEIVVRAQFGCGIDRCDFPTLQQEHRLSGCGAHSLQQGPHRDAAKGNGAAVILESFCRFGVAVFAGALSGDRAELGRGRIGERQQLVDALPHLRGVAISVHRAPLRLSTAGMVRRRIQRSRRRERRSM